MISVALSSCSSSSGKTETRSDSAATVTEEIHSLPDTLRVGTLYSPTSYFIYRETAMGYDYDLIMRFAEDKGVAIELITAPNLKALVAMLDSGKIDVAAYDIPVTSEYNSRVDYCGPEAVTHQVLVQPLGKNKGRLTDVTQLVGKEVYVEADSKYHQRILNLNEELGGGIVIKPVAKDTIITEELIAMVSDGEIPLTIVDSDIAQINRTYFSDLDISLEVSFPQRSAWGVRPTEKWLGDSIDYWLKQKNPSEMQASLLKRYFEESKTQPSYTIEFSHGKMSPFDHLFKEYARAIHWDWRLLSSMGFVESHYDSTQVSWAGARGIMQLMPATAAANGLTQDRITVNRDNIATAAKVIRALDEQFKPLVRDVEERKKFVIAAYNSGPAHILDAIALAKKLGYDNQKWLGSVEQAMMLKSKPQYYNDPACKYGYFNGRQTFDYVHKVYDTYEHAKRKVTL